MDRKDLLNAMYERKEYLFNAECLMCCSERCAGCETHDLLMETEELIEEIENEVE